MDTRTPNRPQGGRAEGSDGGPGLYTVKVPTDPTRLSSTTASFRVRLGTSVSPLIDAQVAAPAFAAASSAPASSNSFFPGLAPDQTQPMLIPALVGAGAAAGAGAGAGSAPGRRRPRVTPITWTGGAAQLMDAVQQGGGAGTGTLPSQQSGSPAEPLDTQPMPLIGAQPGHGGRPEAMVNRGPGHQAAADVEAVGYVDGRAPWGSGPEYQLDPRDSGEPVRHAWYPGRRVDLGLVLLPLRIFLGGISIYAGFSKLCDPVYFDGGARGSMMHWLQSLHPWGMARPLLQFALTHPVGAGLGVAFVQIVVGVLSILGLWQRLAAGTAMLLALALLLTVSWRTVPAYDAPEIIYLAAWSPLLLAGAPLFSLDGRLAIEAWHRLGERAPVSVLRRRVLRRGFVVGTMVVGATLLLGSALGAAVRNTHPVQTVLPATTGLPTEYPAPIYPTGAPVVAKPKAPKAGPVPGASPTAPGKHPTPKHTAGSAHSAAPTHHSGGSTGGSTKPKTPHSPPATGGSTNGVIGGLLGSSAPLPLLGMSRGGAGGSGGTGAGPVT